MSGEKFKLQAKTRKIFGRKVKSLRRQNIIPANIFGKKIESQGIQINQFEFQKIYGKAGETSLIHLEVDGSEAKPVLVSMVQVHPASGDLIHVDFHQVDLKEKVNASVPIHLVGEAPAVKEKGAVLLQVLSEVEVEALPTDIPSQFEIDISSLVEIGDQLTLKDIALDSSKVVINLPLEETIVLTQEPKEEVVEETATESGESSDVSNEAPASEDSTKTDAA